MAYTRFALLAATLLAGLAVPASAKAPADEAAALRAELARIEARLAALEAARTEVPAASAPEAAPAPRWAGAPRFTAPGGWSFKPRGRLQFDAGHVGRPDGVTDDGLGFTSEARRLRLGVEGDIPGGLGYRFELDFAGGSAEVTDAWLSWRAAESVQVLVGQHNNFQGLEEQTSSRFSSFIERAAFTDAFNFERRLGVSAGYARGDVRINAGIFTDNVADLGDDGNKSLGGDARLVYAPEVGEGGRLHLGGSVRYRDTGAGAEGFATRYRQRPLIHSSDTRFLATPSLPVRRERGHGLEAAWIAGPFHAAGELSWLRADLADGRPPARLFGGYVEAGYYLTGETRGYRDGLFDRTRVRRPVGDGGFGAIQLNLRYDHLDLNDGPVRGGRQDGYMASLIWIPQDYVRFMLNYAHLRYDEAALPAAGGRRDYGVDVIGARAQVDF